MPERRRFISVSTHQLPDISVLYKNEDSSIENDEDSSTEK